MDNLINIIKYFNSFKYDMLYYMNIETLYWPLKCNSRQLIFPYIFLPNMADIKIFPSSWCVRTARILARFPILAPSIILTRVHLFINTQALSHEKWVYILLVHVGTLSVKLTVNKRLHIKHRSRTSLNMRSCSGIHTTLVLIFTCIIIRI